MIFIMTSQILPLNIGAISQHVHGPLLVYCPKLSSKKKIGIPTKNNMMQYGMKNTAKIQ